MSRFFKMSYQDAFGSLAWKAALALVLCCLSLRVTVAEVPSLAPNATIRGELSRLRELPARLAERPCSKSDCSFSVSPIHLWLSVKGYAPVNVVFAEAEDTRTVKRESSLQSVNDVAERPVLLRGVGIHRHAGSASSKVEFPVAGTLYRDGGVLVLEVAVSHLNRRALEKLVVARAVVDSTAQVERITGRAIRTSSHAFAGVACGTHEATSHGQRQRGAQIAPQLLTSYSTKILYLGTDFDRDFMRQAKCKTASQCNNKILSFVNQASVYYQQPMSIRLRVDRQYGPVVFTAGTDEAGDMLSDYGAFIESYRGSYLHDGINRGSRLVDGYAGFTGKKMAGGTIGIAWMGVLCANSFSLSANMVIRQLSDSLTATTIAHELGHNLSATHSPSGIMAASANKTGRNPRFTSGSVSEISNYIKGWFEECRGGVNFRPPSDTGPYGPKVSLTVGPYSGYNFSIGLSLQNPRANCFVQVRAAESAAGVATGTIVLETEMQAGSSTRMGNVTTGIVADNAADATVYFKSFYVCSGGTVRAESSLASFVADYGPDDGDNVSRAEWIQEISDRFNG